MVQHDPVKTSSSLSSDQSRSISTLFKLYNVYLFSFIVIISSCVLSSSSLLSSLFEPKELRFKLEFISSLIYILFSILIRISTLVEILNTTSYTSQILSVLLQGISTFASCVISICVAIGYYGTSQKYGLFLMINALHIFGNWYYCFAFLKYPNNPTTDERTTKNSVYRILRFYYANGIHLGIYFLADLYTIVCAFRLSHVEYLQEFANLNVWIRIESVLYVNFCLRSFTDALRFIAGAIQIASVDERVKSAELKE
mmetsp:Transcript_6990/g.12526  ORF Transcript_6990/g.12526 Transcript_6990/m.12526 type:complete len:256 (-) Transcript_6990:481-1248(-)